MLLFLQDRLQHGRVHAGLPVRVGPRRDLLARAAQHERVEQLIGDQLGGAVVVLGAPRGGHAVAQLRVEPRALHRDVGLHAHHVDDERLALRAVQRCPPSLVDERQEVPGNLQVGRVAPGRDGRVPHDPQHLRERRDRLRRTGQVAIRLLAGQPKHRRAVGGDEDRNAMDRREHRLDRRKAVGRRRDAFTRPERPDGVDGAADTLDALGRRVRNAHLPQPQGEAGPERQDDAFGRHLVDGAHRHGEQHGVARVRVQRTQRDPDIGDLGGDGGRVRDGITLEVGIVDPDRLEPPPACPFGPLDDIGHRATCGKTQSHATRQLSHPRPLRSLDRR